MHEVKVRVKPKSINEFSENSVSPRSLTGTEIDQAVVVDGEKSDIKSSANMTIWYVVWLPLVVTTDRKPTALSKSFKVLPYSYDVNVKSVVTFHKQLLTNFTFLNKSTFDFFVEQVRPSIPLTIYQLFLVIERLS